jgi:diguanylate cyclase
MCRVIVEVGGYPFTWVGYAERDKGKSILPVAQAGFDGGLDGLTKAMGSATWVDTDSGHDPTATAIRTGSPTVVHDFLAESRFRPWTEQARRRGYACAAAFPLRLGGQVIGALSMYSQGPGAFDEEEIKLLAESAEDLAFGIATLRTRALHERANETIMRMAYYDSLTNLPNHALLEEQLQQLVADATRNTRRLALLLLDLNRFGEINDTLGFEQGDLLLREVGTRIGEALGEQGVVARMRGDEFAVLLPDSGVGDATQTAARVLAAVQKPLTLSDVIVDVSAAVGIAMFPDHGADAKSLIRRADVAMRLAKKTGNSYSVYSRESDATSPRRLALASGLRHAIEENRLALYYQPKVEMPSGRVIGAEALVRWIHPEEGIIGPDEFIAIAEHTGLIKPMTDWVLSEVLRQAAEWRQSGLVLPVAVNLSARNLQDIELLDKIERLFRVGGGRSGWLELEITESAIMEDPDGALKVLTNLNDLGIALFIDDFGTGYSSLSYLKRLPVDAIKIDRSFIKDMLADSDSAAIVRSTIALAHDLEIKVVAEGVEDQQMWEPLVGLGCDTAQGYWIARPMPATEFARWMSETPWRPQVNAGPGSPKPRRRAPRRAG